MNNPLLDKSFLKKLFHQREREIYIKIISYNKNREIQETIEGLATGGSINIDGNSAVRRSCSLTLAVPSDEAKTASVIHDFYWSLSTQFQLFIGLKNTIPLSGYPDIIWFPMGWYIIATFSKSESLKETTISILGKDKMCQLNGELGGSITSLTADFGKYTDIDGTIKRVPIKDIIINLLRTYAEEPIYNILINDLNEIGLELLEYRGETPLYIFEEIETKKSSFHTLNPKQICYIDGNMTTIEDSTIVFKKLPHSNAIVDELNYTIVALNEAPNPTFYNIIKIEYGEVAGYRRLEEGLVYAGDLILNLGESATMALDKIIEMLGNYEYFYNLDGQFVFQKKRNLVSITTPQIRKKENEDESRTEIYYIPAELTGLTAFEFDSNDLVASKSKNYNTSNIKNDYAIWGKRNNRDIYARYAIDRKPEYYKSYNNFIYYTDHSQIQEAIDAFQMNYNENVLEITVNPPEYLSSQLESQIYTISSDNHACVDWREIIYQMACDYREYNNQVDYYNRLKDNNKHLVRNGQTGYEKYYTDLEGHWREIYNPKPPAIYTREPFEIINNTVNNLFTDSIMPIGIEDAQKVADKENLYLIRDNQLLRWIDTVDFEAEFENELYNLYYDTNEGTKQILDDLDFITNQVYLENKKGEKERLFLLLDSEQQNRVYYSSSQNGPKKKLQDFLRIESFNSVPDFVCYNRPYAILKEDSNSPKQPIPVDTVYAIIGETKILLWQYDYQVKQLSNETIEVLIEAQTTQNSVVGYSLSGYGEVMASEVEEIQIQGEYNSENKILWYLEDDGLAYTALNDKFLHDGSLSEEEAKEQGYIGNKFETYFYLLAPNDDKEEFYKATELIDIDKAKIKYYDTAYMYIKDKISIDEKLVLYYYNSNKKMYLGNNSEILFVEDRIDNDLKEEIYQYQDAFVEYFIRNRLALNGEESKYYKKTDPIKSKIKYYSRDFDYILKTGYDCRNCWNKEVYNDFTKANFWFDFIDTTGQIDKFSVNNIGDRIKTEKNDKLSVIDFGDIPNVLYVEQEIKDDMIDYLQIQFSWQELIDMFEQSAQGISIIDQVNNYLDNLFQSASAISMSIIPVYTLDANQQIQVENKFYNIARITIPLNYKGMMSIEANILG